MKTAQNDIIQNIASSLGQIQGAPVDPKSLVPEVQHHFDNPLQQIINPETEADMEDFMAGMKGRPRTEPSKNFLKTFLNRLRKKNPDAFLKEDR